MDQLEQDQNDFFYRISADEYFSDVKVLLESKGDIESDVSQALSVLLEKDSKIGACAVVLMPTLQPDSPNLPGPRSVVRMEIQVIDQPTFNLGETGTGKSASQIAERVRQICHHFASGRGAVYSFAGQSPIPTEPGKNSYGVAFTRLAGDCPVRKVSTPAIAASATVAPATITLTCATAGAAIYYTLDGSSPYPSNTSAALYATPIDVTVAALVRAAATLADHQPSDVAQKPIS